MFKVRRGSREKIPLVQGKEQRLRFAGAAMKRYPTYKVRETQDTLVYSKKEMMVNYKIKSKGIVNGLKMRGN